MLNFSKDAIVGLGRSLVITGLVGVTVGCAGINTPPIQGDTVDQVSAAQVSTATVTKTHRLVNVPETDCDIRVWYNYQVVAIPVINNRWIKTDISLKERAKRAYTLRHNARINARFMMSSAEEVKMLQARDMAKYGNPDGPTFDYLIAKSLNSGLTEQQAYQNMITSSARTDNSYNEQCE